MLKLATHVNLRKLRKHPRGPKKSPAQRTANTQQFHVSTARLLKQHKVSKKKN